MFFDYYSYWWERSWISNNCGDCGFANPSCTANELDDSIFNFARHGFIRIFPALILLNPDIIRTWYSFFGVRLALEMMGRRRIPLSTNHYFCWSLRWYPPAVHTHYCFSCIWLESFRVGHFHDGRLPPDKLQVVFHNYRHLDLIILPIGQMTSQG